MSMYPRSVIEELNALSKEVLGAPSRWRKWVEEGEIKLYTEEQTQFDPNANNGAGEEKKITVPVLHHGSKGGKMLKRYLHRYTPETVKIRLLEIKAQKEEWIANLIRQQTEQKAAQEAETAKKLADEAAFNTAKTVDQASGSAAL